MSEQKKDTRTEFEKLKAGELFWNSDPEILAVKSRARALADSYNRTTEDQPEERLRILKELFGDCDDDIFIKPPFYCDYGFNLHVGKKFFANFACVMLDVAPITIGDNCVIGAGSVVNRSLPAGYLAAGNPCRPLRPITAAERGRYLEPSTLVGV